MSGEGVELTGRAAHAYGALSRALARSRPISEADTLALQAAAKAWARWRMVEDELAKRADEDPLLSEMARAEDGSLKASPLRAAAKSAFAEYDAIARSLGLQDIPGAADNGEIDLFGYPDRPGRGQKGRPRFRATLRDRNRVKMLLAVGWSNERIAAALEVSLPTLRKYFRRELEERAVMRDRVDARRLEIAFTQAQSGNVSALKELDRLIERQDLAAGRGPSAVPKADEPSAPVGKKEQQRVRAQEPRGGWQDRLSRRSLDS